VSSQVRDFRASQIQDSRSSFATSGLRRFKIPDLHRFATSGLRRFKILDLHRFATSELRRLKIPDLHRFVTSGLRRFKIPDLHQVNYPENSFHEFRPTRRFEGDMFFLNSPTVDSISGGNQSTCANYICKLQLGSLDLDQRDECIQLMVS
jgi:hypothetical protein